MHPNSDFLYRQIVQSVGDYAIFALDEGGRVVSWNPGAGETPGQHAWGHCQGKQWRRGEGG